MSHLRKPPRDLEGLWLGALMMLAVSAVGASIALGFGLLFR